MNVMEPVSRVDQETLGHRIRRARLEKYLSLEQLAEQLGVSKVTVWNWENNRTQPRYPRLEKMSAALGVPVDVLVSGAEPAGQNVSDLIYDCQCRIAEAVGVEANHVEIKVTFVGQAVQSGQESANSNATTGMGG